jgi:hypothetical protein
MGAGEENAGAGEDNGLLEETVIPPPPATTQPNEPEPARALHLHLPAPCKKLSNRSRWFKCAIARSLSRCTGATLTTRSPYASCDCLCNAPAQTACAWSRVQCALLAARCRPASPRRLRVIPSPWCGKKLRLLPRLYSLPRPLACFSIE